MDKLKSSISSRWSQLTPKIKDLTPMIQSFASETYQKIKDMPLQPFKKNTTHLGTDYLIPITQKIYWMTFPSQQNVQTLATYLNQHFANNYYIWNISEHSFPTEYFQNQVMVAIHSHPGYPCPPLLEILTICKNIIVWLSSDPENIALINCQSAKGRSVLIISVLVAILGNFHPGETLLKVCELTKIQDYSALFPSQHQYLNYIENILSGLKTNSTSLRLVSIVFSSVPQVKDEPSFKPYIQLFSKGKIIFNSLSNQNITTYQVKDLSIIYEIGGLQVTNFAYFQKVNDDILIRCKHFQSNDVRIALFRVMFNTGFVFGNVLRFSIFELDVTSNFISPKDFFLDLIFERGQQKSSQKAWQENKQESEKNAVSEDNNSQQYLSQILNECQTLVTNNPTIKIQQENFFQTPNQITIIDSKIQKEGEVKNIPIGENKNHAFIISTDSESSGRSSLDSQINAQENQPQEKISQPPLSKQVESIEEEEIEEQSENVPSGEKQMLYNQIISNIHEDQNLGEDDDEINDYLNKLEQEQ